MNNKELIDRELSSIEICLKIPSENDPNGYRRWVTPAVKVERDSIKPIFTSIRYKIVSPFQDLKWVMEYVRELEARIDILVNAHQIISTGHYNPEFFTEAGVALKQEETRHISKAVLAQMRDWKTFPPQPEEML